MRLRYYISTKENLLYGNKYYYQGRFQTYGQHSFIYDFLVNAFKQGIKIDLIIDELKNFPVYKIIQPYCNLIEWKKANDLELEIPDIAIVDVIAENMMGHLPEKVPKICIIHNAGTVFDNTFIERCDCFVCMTEAAWNFQSKRISPGKLLLIHQGVDLDRFRPQNEILTLIKKNNPSILVYTRMNHEKRETIFSVLSELKEGSYHVTILGDGPLFWELCDLYGDRFIIINYISYQSISIFLQQFDLIISSGRGVMESCASGKPTICAGLGYGGILTKDNVTDLLKRNLTGYGRSYSATKLMADINNSLEASPEVWRKIAELYFDVNLFIDKIKLKIEEVINMQIN